MVVLRRAKKIITRPKHREHSEVNQSIEDSLPAHPVASLVTGKPKIIEDLLETPHPGVRMRKRDKRRSKCPTPTKDNEDSEEWLRGRLAAITQPDPRWSRVERALQSIQGDTAPISLLRILGTHMSSFKSTET